MLLYSLLFTHILSLSSDMAVLAARFKMLNFFAQVGGLLTLLRIRVNNLKV